MHLIKGLRLRAVLSAAVLAAVPLSLAAAPVAAQLPSPTYSMHFKVKVSGAPNGYQLQVDAEHSGIPSNMYMYLRRFASSGNHPEQVHEYDVADTQTVCSSLANCHVSDNGNLGSFGRISLNFSPTAPAKSHQDLCYNDHTISLGTITERKGTLTGTFRLNTGTGYFGSVTNSAHGVHIPRTIPATARKYQSNGNDCPSDPPSGCVAGLAILSFPALGSDQIVVAQKDARSSKGFMQFTWQPASGNDKVELHHSIFGDVPKKSVTITDNSPELEHVRANFNQLAPFVSGVGNFSATDPPNFGSACHEVDRNGNLVGPLTVHFDGFGTVHFTTAPASVFRYQAS